MRDKILKRYRCLLSSIGIVGTEVNAIAARMARSLIATLGGVSDTGIRYTRWILAPGIDKGKETR